jgi:hypothetical protein
MRSRSITQMPPKRNECGARYATTRERKYLPPPTVDKPADLDLAVLVTPLKGLEVGYVPIVTRQGMKEK